MEYPASRMICRRLFALSFALFPHLAVHGQQTKDLRLSNRTTALSPEEQRKTFRLAAGFVAELVASEKDGVVKPIDLAFDDAGNLWTQTATMYPLDPVADIRWNDLLELMNDRQKQDNHPAFRKIADLYKGVTRGDDRILKISEPGGRHSKVSVWAYGLALPMSVLPYQSGAFVAQGSEILFLEDTDGDGRADLRKPLFTGFGFTDSHTMTHLLRKGPGGWIHFSHGALNKGQVSSYLDSTLKVSFDYSKIGRFSTDGRRIEVLTAGLNNIWGFTLRADGQWYGSEANDLGYAVIPLEEGAAFPGIGNAQFKPYQPFFPEVNSFRIGGTGLSGLAFSEDEQDGFPPYWQNTAFLANPITNTINAIRVIRQPDGSIETERLEDLLVSEDEWFRPVNICFGPDGFLYVADWYNKIVSHNEFPTSHPDRDKKHGRIWRIRHEGQPVRQIRDFYTLPTHDLPTHLKSPYLWERRAAWNQISERSPSETQSLIPVLTAILLDQTSRQSTRIHALWSLEALGFFDKKTIGSLLSDRDSQVRREALRFLGSHPGQISHYLPQLGALLDDPEAAVRSRLLLSLGTIAPPDPEVTGLLIKACRPDATEVRLGGPYERKFERYLARKALERHPEQLENFLNGHGNTDFPDQNILWAILALPPSNRADYYFRYAGEIVAPVLSEETFLELADIVHDSRARELLSASISHPHFRMNYLSLSLKNKGVLNTPGFRTLLEKPLSDILKNSSGDERKKALEVIVAFSPAIAEEDIVHAIGGTQDQDFLRQAVRALDVVKAVRPESYSMIANNLSNSLELRLNSLPGLTRTSRTQGAALARRWLDKMDAIEKKTFTRTLSHYDAGSSLLLELYREGRLEEDDFEITTAERIRSLTDDPDSASRLLQTIERRTEEQKTLLTGRISTLKKLNERAGGNLKNGELLFQTCLLCHQVAGKGQMIAPALDGLGYRDPEALLYAILDPDAAIEAGYAIFRIVRKDNSILEGYLVSSDSNGTTLGVMGGSKTFVAASDIKSQHHVAGKSFMPAGLFDNLNENEIVDILSYIKTIN